jgi:hypothetical protein
MKLRVLLIGVLLTPVLVWAATSALGSEPPQRFTACLSGGKLTLVTTGDKPLQPCKSKQEQVSWAGQGPPGLPGEPGETGSPGPAGTDGPGRMPGEQWLDLAASGPSAAWSCSSGPCEVFGPGPLEGAQSVGCGTITRTLDPMPPHSKVRIQVTVGFVDDWQGDTAYLSVGTPDHQDVFWTQSRDQRLDRSRVNVVNDPRFPDMIGQAVDVVVSHAETRLTIMFGTTLDCSAAAALAVDALSVSVAP